MAGFLQADHSQEHPNAAGAAQLSQEDPRICPVAAVGQHPQSSLTRPREGGWLEEPRREYTKADPSPQAHPVSWQTGCPPPPAGSEPPQHIRSSPRAQTP